MRGLNHQPLAVHGLGLLQRQRWQGDETLQSAGSEATPAADAAAGSIAKQPQLINLVAVGPGREAAPLARFDQPLLDHLPAG
jgi:hypothetical protein